MEKNITVTQNELMAISTLADLKRVSLGLTGTIMLESVLCTEDYPHQLASEPEKSFCYNNGVLAFIADGIYYVVPHTSKANEIIRQSGFKEAYFSVICSNLDQPADPFMRARWHTLQTWNREIREYEFIRECEQYCDEHYIESISEKLLARYCMAMPSTGISVKYLFQEKPSRHYPAIISTFLDSNDKNKLGKYCYNNGTLVFVHRDGKTYVTKAYWLIDILTKCGYKEGNLFVPFSNGEKILEDKYHQQWEKIKVVCSE